MPVENISVVVVERNWIVLRSGRDGLLCKIEHRKET